MFVRPSSHPSNIILNAHSPTYRIKLGIHDTNYEMEMCVSIQRKKSNVDNLIIINRFEF